MRDVAWLTWQSRLQSRFPPRNSRARAPGISPFFHLPIGAAIAHYSLIVDSRTADVAKVEVVEEGGRSPLEHVDHYLMIGKESGASDIHLAVGSRPSWRRFGTLEPIWLRAPVLTAADTARLAGSFLTEAQWRTLADRGDVDFAYSNASGRYRACIVKQRLGYDLTFRIFSSQIRTLADLGLPSQIKLLTQYHNGLILVTGSVGSGKSTTLAALVEEINLTRRDHIITLEDPIEYLIPSKSCHVTQREVHTHTVSFAHALRGALREDPDVVMVGEMRDLETISLAITASETGHLVLGTLHTGNAARTLDRVLDVFPNDQRDQIRVMVSESLRGIISQQLVPRSDNAGRCLATEILINNPAVGNLVREGKTFMLPGVIQTGKKQGMQLMDDSLLHLCRAGLIAAEESLYRAENKTLMRQALALK
jgi:twitching motility protein PilT